MTALLRCILCALGGIAVGSYLVCLKFPRTWIWDNSWVVIAFIFFVLFSFIALRVMVPSYAEIFAATPIRDILMIFLFGLIAGTGVYVWPYITTVLDLALTYALANSAGTFISVVVPLFGTHMDRVRELDGVTLLIASAFASTADGRAGRVCRDARPSLGRCKN